MARTKQTARKSTGGMAPRKTSGLKSPAKIRDLVAAEKEPRCQECGLALSAADIVEDKEIPGHELALTDTTHCRACIESRQAREAEREARKTSSAKEKEEGGDAPHKHKHKRLTRTIDKKKQQQQKHQQGAKGAGTKKNKGKKEKPERKVPHIQEAKSLSKSLAVEAEEKEEEEEEDSVHVDASNKYVKALQKVYATYEKPVNIVVYKRGLHVVVRNEPPAGKSTWTRDDLIREAERVLAALVISPGSWAGDYCVYHVTGYVPDGSLWMVGFPSHYKDRESVMVVMPEQPKGISDFQVGFTGRDLAMQDREDMEVLAVIQRNAPTDEFRLI